MLKHTGLIQFINTYDDIMIKERIFQLTVTPNKSVYLP